MKDPRPLGSTYRLQLAGFGFDGARSIVGYLHDLGIETLYLSPILEAVPGSTHGYDVVNPTRLDPSLGTPQDFAALLDELETHGMRVLIDIVPNHMACHRSNGWWWDVLRHGESSPFASTFDIDWSRHGGRVLVPTLPSPLSDLGDSMEIVRDGPDRVLEIDTQAFPLAPATLESDGLRDVVDSQNYRPAFWRLNNHEGNYRRFFDIDGLIGVRVEEPDVFERTHRFLASISEDERVAGWRVDHIDGLSDPRTYLERLGALSSDRATRAVTLLEKIVARGEVIPGDWETDGTTGYEFSDRVGGLFVNARGANELARGSPTFLELSRAAQREVVNGSFDAALERLTRLALALLDDDHFGHDLSSGDVRVALAEITVHLDVYRTYLDAVHSDTDPERLSRAATGAATALMGEARRAARLVADLLASSRSDARELVERWQQLSSAVMAKGAEDTATYRYVGLLSHADVGADPDEASCDPTTFHRFVAERRTYPLALNATSTHDSKRSEDSRARLFALSELADEWNTNVQRWHRRYRADGVEPAIEDELRAYQSLLCLWPLASTRVPRGILRRVQDYAIKAAREAKQHSSWSDPVPRYERSLRRFVSDVAGDEQFARELRRFLERIAPSALTNSLATVVLKCLAPGVPDFYQGTERFTYTLTDPDNRHTIDFSQLRAGLSRLPGSADVTPRMRVLRTLLTRGEADALKMYVTRTLLHLRRDQPDLFAHGDYHALTVAGEFKDNVVAMARSRAGQWVVGCVGRQTIEVAGRGRHATAGRWSDTSLRLPIGAPRDYLDIFTGARISAARGRLAVSTCFAEVPVSVLVSAPSTSN